MNKALFLILISFKLLATNSYEISNLILEKENVNIKKEKYLEESVSPSKLTLLNYNIEFLNKEMELKKSLIAYKKEQSELIFTLDSLEKKLSFYNKKETFFLEYIKIMKENKENFSILDIKEAELYLNDVQESKKEYLNQINISKINLENFYNNEFNENITNYEEWLKDKISSYDSYLDNKKNLLEILEESSFNKQINDNEELMTKNLLNQELITIQYEKNRLNASKNITACKLKNISNKINTYKLKSEKEDKQLKLGMITQKEYFDFYNEYFDLEVEKNNFEKELKIIKTEEQLYK